MQFSVHVTFRTSIVSLLLTGLLTGAASADVWTVDRDGSEDFVLVQDAVDAAADGDTILVKRQHENRWSEEVVVDGKGLTLIAFDPIRLPIGAITVRNLGPDQTFVLSRFRVLKQVGLGYQATTDPFAVGVLLENNSGSVRLQDCVIHGTAGWNHPGYAGPGTHAIRIVSCEDVAITNCDVVGGIGYEDPHDAGFGLVARSSRVSAYRSTVSGGQGGYDGGHINNSTGGAGGDGVRAFGGDLYLAGCEVSGGGGGSGGGFEYSFGGPGGNGLGVLQGAGVQAVSSTFSAGSGGFGITDNGEDGLATRGRISFVTSDLPSVGADVDFGYEGTAVDVRVTGTAGDEAFLLLSRTTLAIPLAPEQGIRHTAAARRIALGTIPANGELVHPLALPSLASGAALLHLQAEVRQGAGSPRYSNPFSLTALDDDHAPVCGERVYVDANAAPGGDGTSWATAYDDLRLALNAQSACPDDPTEIWVAEGTYRAAPPAGDRDLTFRLQAGVHLYGGFAGTETQLAERDPALHPVILTGDLNGDDLAGFQNRSDNSRHVVETGSLLFRSENVRLDGVTVRGGEAGDGTDHDGGAGIRSRCDGLIVARCTVEDNRAAGYASGGGLLHWRSRDIRVLESVFQGNEAGGSGGGLYVSAADHHGDGFISNCVVRGNTAGQYGGGLYIRTVGGHITGTTVHANAAQKWGGIRIAPTSDTVFAFQVSNCISWNNTDTLPDSDVFAENFDCPYPAWTALRYSCIEGWTNLGGPSNLGLDPQFLDPAGPDGIPGTADDDLRLGQASPCIDAGRNSSVLPDFADLDHDGDTSEPTPTDLDHLPRFVDDPAVVDTGNGTAPIVDMGAYEHPHP